MLVAATGPLHWQAHPEVWVLVLATFGFGIYVSRVIQPVMVAAGEPPIAPRQRWFFAAALAVLWLASDWPMHDVAEEYLYSVHMVQHLLLTFVFPPLLLMATPGWLVRLVFGAGRFGRILSRIGRPLVAGLLFNALVALTHAAWIVNTSVRVGAFHYVVHVVVVSAALLMWMPVCGPVPELRMSIPQQMGYLFLMSVLPTIPAAFLTVAEVPLYRSYDGPFRLWGVTTIQDQQAAGLTMKLAGGFYLWSIIAVLFFTWASRHQEADRARLQLTEREVLTFDQVQAEFERSIPVPDSTADRGR